jgi:predicted methyltransferase
MTNDLSASELLRDVAQAVALVEGEGGIRDVLRIVAAHEPVAVRRISRSSELPVPIVAAVCAELRKRGVVARERPVRLTPLGRELYAERSVATTSFACPSCGGDGLHVSNALDDVMLRLTRVAGSAPRARAEIDQSHCTVSTKVRRVLLLHEAGALAGRRVLLLGDDDLTSVAIGDVGRHLGFDRAIRELVVVDVDKDVLAFCRRRLAGAPFPITFVQHDLRAPLPPTLNGHFDTVFTDPPYTPEGAELFLSRAVTALSTGARSNVFLCFGMKPPDESLRLQTAIANMGFVIRRLIRNFNDYEGAGTLAGTSNLYHLMSTNVMRPVIPDQYGGRLYTGDKRRTRRYRCSSCRATEVVGPDQKWATIGDLKSRGCPRCGNATFRPLPRD